MQDQPISRTRLLQEGRIMKFESTYEDWVEGRLTQSEAAAILGQCERTFRRNIDRFKSDGLSGLMDLRISKVSMKKAGKKEIDYAVNLYKDTFKGWNVAHFHSVYKTEFKGERSYSWLKTVLQGAGVVRASKKVGKHRIKRERAPLPGMMLHQDASTHRWVPESVWDLVVTMDDATSVHTSMFFCDQEGTQSSFHGLGQTISRYGLFASFYTDRGSHYFTTPEAGGKVDKVNLTEVGRALKQLGITHIAAYSPQARGRSERAFQTHQGRLPQELARAGITTMEQANRYLDQIYMVAYNKEFGVASTLEGSAYVNFIHGTLCDILCEQYDRKVDNSNCVSFEGMKLQIPADEMRYHYVRAEVQVHKYVDQTLSIFHGPRKLATYDRYGVNIKNQENLKMAA